MPDDLTTAMNRLTGWAIAQGVSLDGLEITRPSLEDVYLALTGSGEAADLDGRAAGPDPAAGADPAGPELRPMSDHPGPTQ